MTDGRQDGLREWLSQVSSIGELARMVGRANANATAQTTSAGLGIENIRRGVAVATIDGVSNVTVANATSGFAVLSTPLSVDMTLSGRPIAIRIAAKVSAGAGGTLKLSARLRGVEVTGTTEGIPGLYRGNTTAGLDPQGIYAEWIVTAPTAGQATIDVVADATTADGFIYISSGAHVAYLAVVEL